MLKNKGYAEATKYALGIRCAMFRLSGVKLTIKEITIRFVQNFSKKKLTHLILSAYFVFWVFPLFSAPNTSLRSSGTSDGNQSLDIFHLPEALPSRKQVIEPIRFVKTFCLIFNKKKLF